MIKDRIITALLIALISLTTYSIIADNRARYTEGFIDGFSQGLYTTQSIEALPEIEKENLMAKLRKALGK